MCGKEQRGKSVENNNTWEKCGKNSVKKQWKKQHGKSAENIWKKWGKNEETKCGENVKNQRVERI